MASPSSLEFVASFSSEENSPTDSCHGGLQTQGRSAEPAKRIPVYPREQSRMSWMERLPKAQCEIESISDSSETEPEQFRETTDSINNDLREFVRCQKGSGDFADDSREISATKNVNWSNLSLHTARVDDLSEVNYPARLTNGCRIAPNLSNVDVALDTEAGIPVFRANVTREDIDIIDKSHKEPSVRGSGSIWGGLSLRGEIVGADGHTTPKYYSKLFLPSDELVRRTSRSEETVRAIKLLTSTLTMRSEFVQPYRYFDSPCILPPVTSPTDPWGSREPRFLPEAAPILENLRGYTRIEKGVVRVYTDLNTESGKDEDKEKLEDLVNIIGINIPTVENYLSALKKLMKVVQHPAVKSVCYQRLKYLEDRFAFHLLFNGPEEVEEVRNNCHRDFYNVRKVDTHVHHSACMTQKHLLRYIRRKCKMNCDEKVYRDGNGNEMTLQQLFQENIGLSAWETSIDHLDVHAMNTCFHRFDKFNTKYNLFGAALLREVFLKTDNMLGGKYLAELTHEVIDDLEAAKYQQVEWRVSIYGHSPHEWIKLARWLLNHRLKSRRVRWVIQVPRLYHILRSRNKIKSMEEFLENVFSPVIEAVLKPRQNPEIFQMLRQTVAWDSVDDESVVSKFTMAGGELPEPKNWVHDDNPPYAYWCYYMYANIRVLNTLLQARGMNPMPFRPHCGEAGSISHLASAGLLADGINHGIMLRKSPVLQYLYYLWQVGLAMSPLSNNALFHEITKSPLINFFKIGHNVSLSSDDPLMFHFTDEALLEEYSVCAHIWKLSPVDLCELARNSVLQSNFEPQFKRHWLGANYHKRGAKGNDIRATNVSDIRLIYREETLMEELKFLRDVVMRSTIEEQE